MRSCQCGGATGYLKTGESHECRNPSRRYELCGVWHGAGAGVALPAAEDTTTRFESDALHRYFQAVRWGVSRALPSSASQLRRRANSAYSLEMMGIESLTLLSTGVSREWPDHGITATGDGALSEP